MKEENCPFDVILKSRIGSHCHGTNMQDSDEDIRGICVPPIDYFFGIKNWEQTTPTKVDGNDVEYWSIQKLISLCVKGNPSALNILFVNKKDILFADEWGKSIIDFKDNFLSKRVITGIVGYINSQIHKMAIGRGRCGNRQELIDKYGFDTHFAYHATMLSHIGIELVKTGTYHTLRPNEEQQYIKQLRVGKIPYEDVMKRIGQNLVVIKTLEPSCSLPDAPDEEKINNFIVDLLKNYFELYAE